MSITPYIIANSVDAATSVKPYIVANSVDTTTSIKPYIIANTNKEVDIKFSLLALVTDKVIQTTDIIDSFDTSRDVVTAVNSCYDAEVKTYLSTVYTYDTSRELLTYHLEDVRDYFDILRKTTVVGESVSDTEVKVTCSDKWLFDTRLSETRDYFDYLNTYHFELISDYSSGAPVSVNSRLKEILTNEAEECFDFTNWKNTNKAYLKVRNFPSIEKAPILYFSFEFKTIHYQGKDTENLTNGTGEGEYLSGRIPMFDLYYIGETENYSVLSFASFSNTMVQALHDEKVVARLNIPPQTVSDWHKADFTLNRLTDTIEVYFDNELSATFSTNGIITDKELSHFSLNVYRDYEEVVYSQGIYWDGYLNSYKIKNLYVSDRKSLVGMALRELKPVTETSDNTIRLNYSVGENERVDYSQIHLKGFSADSEDITINNEPCKTADNIVVTNPMYLLKQGLTISVKR